MGWDEQRMGIVNRYASRLVGPKRIHAFELIGWYRRGCPGMPPHCPRYLEPRDDREVHDEIEPVLEPVADAV